MSQSVELFVEDAMLSASPSSIEVDKGKTAVGILSNGKGWSSDDWTNADDED